MKGMHMQRSKKGLTMESADKPARKIAPQPTKDQFSIPVVGLRDAVSVR